MFKSILVAVDGSTHIVAALQPQFRQRLGDQGPIGEDWRQGAFGDDDADGFGRFRD